MKSVIDTQFYVPRLPVDMDVFVANFFFQVMRKGLSDRDAWWQAMRVTDQPDIYKMSFFHRDGREERYQEGK